jgi:hypothetical protein
MLSVLLALSLGAPAPQPKPGATPPPFVVTFGVYRVDWLGGVYEYYLHGDGTCACRFADKLYEGTWRWDQKLEQLIIIEHELGSPHNLEVRATKNRIHRRE